MKHAILIASSLALLSLVPAAAADISILGGTAVIHTDGDPGVSALGDPVLRVVNGCPGFTVCLLVYGDPAGLVPYAAGAWGGSCPSVDNCAGAGLASSGGFTGVLVLSESGTIEVQVCALASCAVTDVGTAPPCVKVNDIEVVCVV